MAELVRIGAVARVDPRPEDELRVWHEDLRRGEIDDPESTQRRLENQERGRAVIVRLDLFADLAGPDGRLERLDGATVPGLWFHVSQDEENVAHAEEMVRENLGLLRADLLEHGLAVDVGTLEKMPIRVEVAADLARALEAR